MGCCGSSDENNQRIGKYMTNEEAQDGKTFKLLLLGPGSTGKSTLFKSLRISYSGDIKRKEKKTVLIFMRQNVVFSLITLLEQSDRLHTKDATKYEACKIANITPELTEKIQLIQKYQKEPGDMDESNPDINYNELAQLALAIEYIWNLDGIQATFRNRANNFVFDDNMDFFYSKVKEIFTENYVPTNEDCLKNRIKTTGMTQYEYTPEDAKSNRFKIVDVGGQRAERGKCVNGLLFVASLVDYNAVLYEDETVNGMVESAKLFDDMTKLDTFKNCALILILNKDDLLEALLRSGNHGLEDCFSEKGPWQNPEEFWETSIDEQFRQGQIEFNDYHQEVVAFIGDLFENRNNLKTRMYKHTTIATRNQVVKQVFHDIQTIMVQNALKQSGYWAEATPEHVPL